MASVDTLSPAQRSERMSRVRSRDTKPELLVRKLVHGLGYRYRLHGKDLPGRPDLVFGPRRKVIMVYGCFWHGHDCPRGARMPQNNRAYWEAKISRNMARDKASLAALKKLGWTPRVIWECQTRDDAALARLITRQVGKRAST